MTHGRKMGGRLTHPASCSLLKVLATVLLTTVQASSVQYFERKVCLESRTDIYLDCHEATDARIHVQKAIIGHTSSPCSGTFDDVIYHADCHVVVTEHPAFLNCDLKESCRVTVEQFSLNTCPTSLVANFISVKYRCLAGSPESILCPMGGGCSALTNWTYPDGLVTNEDSGWSEPYSWYSNQYDYSYSYHGSASDWWDHENYQDHYGYYYETPDHVLTEYFNYADIPENRFPDTIPDEADGISIYIPKERPFIAHIASPNYPYSYPNNIDGACVLQTLPGATLHIQIERFHIEEHDVCDSDYLTLKTHQYDAHLCNTIQPGTRRVLDTHAATILFHTDRSGGFMGFLITVWAEGSSGASRRLGVFCGPVDELEQYMNTTWTLHLLRQAIHAQKEEESSVPVAVIAGAAAGVVVLAVIIAIVVCQRRSKSKQPRLMTHADTPPNQEVPRSKASDVYTVSDGNTYEPLRRVPGEVAPAPPSYHSRGPLHHHPDQNALPRPPQPLPSSAPPAYDEIRESEVGVYIEPVSGLAGVHRPTGYLNQAYQSQQKQGNEQDVYEMIP